MAIPPAAPNQYFTPTFDKEMPQSTATHFRQLYLATQQHDQAIKLLHSSPSTTTTVVREVSGGGSGGTGVIPGNTPAIAGEAIVSYDSSNGMFGQAAIGNFLNIGSLITPTNATLTSGAFTTTGTVASVTLAAIPAGYLSLAIKLMAPPLTGNTDQEICLQFNGDTANDYGWAANGGYAGGNFAGGSNVSNDSSMKVTFSGAVGIANYPLSASFELIDYAGAQFKTMVGTSMTPQTGGLIIVTAMSGAWADTAAITSIKIFPLTGSFVAGTKIIVYALS